MSKEEFLQILRNKLSNTMPQSEVESQVDYYSAYINGELRKGKTEEEIIEELGDPALIARTLTGAVKRANEGNGYDNFYDNSTFYEDESGNYEEESAPKQKSTQSSGAGCVIAIIVILLIIIGTIVLAIFLGITIIKYLWPVILVLVIGGIIFGAVRRR